MGASWGDRDTGWVDGDAAWSAGETDRAGETVRAVPQHPQSAIRSGPATAATRAAGGPGRTETARLGSGGVAAVCQGAGTAPRADSAAIPGRDTGRATARGTGPVPTGPVRSGRVRATSQARVGAHRVVIAGNPGPAMAGGGGREVLRLVSPLTTTVSLASFAGEAPEPCAVRHPDALPGLSLRSHAATSLRLSSPIEIEQTTV